MYFAVMGIFPLWPTGIEAGCEIVFPIGEGITYGWFSTSAALFGGIITLILSIVIDGDSKQRSRIGGGFSITLYIIASVAILFVKFTMNRLNTEKNKNLQ